MKTFLAIVVIAVVLWFTYAFLRFLYRVIRQIWRKPSVEMQKPQETQCEISDAAAELTIAAKIAAPLAGFVAWLAAPTGLGALGVYLGIIRAPAAVLVASALIVFTISAGFLAALATLYVSRQKSIARTSKKPSR